MNGFANVFYIIARESFAYTTPLYIRGEVVYVDASVLPVSIVYSVVKW